MVEVRSVRKNINFPVSLLSRVDELIQRLNIDFSKFVREATEEKLKQIEKEKLAQELAEGYKANAKLDIKTCNDFKYVDGENI